MIVEDVPDRLWGSRCALCPLPIARSDADDSEGITLTFTAGEWRLVHTPCIDRYLNGGVR